jgi:hypothetical protein
VVASALGIRRVKTYRQSLEIRAARTKKLPTAPGYLDYLATLARCGDYQQAAQRARLVRAASGKNMHSLVDLACCFAICSDSVAANKTQQPSTTFDNCSRTSR